MSLKDIILPYGEPILTGTPDSVLAAMYRDILSDLFIEEGRFLLMVNKYVTRNISPEYMKEISSIRGNVRKELMKIAMTWKVFIKGLRVINIRKFDLEVGVMLKNGKGYSAVVSRTVLLDPSIVPKDKTEISKPSIVLASLLKGIFEKLHITTKVFSELLASYILKANVPVNMKEVSSARGNIKKELLKNSITWKVFIKGLVFLNVAKFVVTIRLYHIGSKVTEHTRTINLDSDYFDLTDTGDDDE